MAENAKFNIGFLKVSGEKEHMFLSVTPGFEHGPGIQRDGITAPRMRDPHCVPYVCDAMGLPHDKGNSFTIDPYIQRAGTWTLYHHVKEFVKKKGNEYRVIGVQSCGDLTMNEWHIAYLGTSHHIPQLQQKLCGLFTANDTQEPFHSRIYRCIVKWNDEASRVLGKRYEALELEIHEIETGYQVTLNNPEEAKEHYLNLRKLKELKEHRTKVLNIAPLLDFALSGKPIVEKRVELPLSNAIDRFLDVRHIFNLPTVKAKGNFQGQDVKEIIFGEYQLFHNLNERRAALFSPVIIDLNTGGHVYVKWKDLCGRLMERHFTKSSECPARRNQFRGYPNEIDPQKVEIFFPHNVYPFGVLGINPKEMVCLASGGLSGRVGNTLEGIGRIMFDFFACDDAMVLDEGYDTFHIINPKEDKEEENGSYKYTNKQLLKKILKFTKDRIDEDQRNSLENLGDQDGMKGLCLNKRLVKFVDQESKKIKEPDKMDYGDVLVVPPNRSQMRSVLIFAVKEKKAGRKKK